MFVAKDIATGMKRTRRGVYGVREHVLSNAVLNSGSSVETVSFSTVNTDPSAWHHQFTKCVSLTYFLPTGCFDFDVFISCPALSQFCLYSFIHARC